MRGRIVGTSTRRNSNRNNGEKQSELTTDMNGTITPCVAYILQLYQSFHGRV